jgi:hypothetical protein
VSDPLAEEPGVAGWFRDLHSARYHILSPEQPDQDEGWRAMCGKVIAEPDECSPRELSMIEGSAGRQFAERVCRRCRSIMEGVEA